MKKILLYADFGAGNILFLMPLAAALWNNAKGYEVDVLLFDNNPAVKLLNEAPYINRIINVNTKLFGKRNKLLALINLFFLRLNHDILVIRFSRSKLLKALCFFKKFNELVGHENYYEHKTSLSHLLTRSTVAKFDQHEIDINLQIASLFEKAGSASQWQQCFRDLGKLQALVTDNVNGKRVCVIHPGSSVKQDWKRLPLQDWCDVSNEILTKYDLLVVVGTNDERHLGEQIKSKVSAPERVKNLAGELSILDTVRVLNTADLFLGADSFIIHLAAVLDVEVIGFYGPTDWTRTYPKGQNVTILRQNCACNLKGRLDPATIALIDECGGRCMKKFNIEKLSQTVKGL